MHVYPIHLSITMVNYDNHYIRFVRLGLFGVLMLCLSCGVYNQIIVPFARLHLSEHLNSYLPGSTKPFCYEL